MFKTIDTSKPVIAIPEYKSDYYYHIKWLQEETLDDVIQNHNGSLWTTFTVYPGGEQHGEYSDFVVDIYEMQCFESDCFFYLITLGGLNEFDCLNHSVSVSYNQFNLLEFYKEVLLPFAGKSYTHGD